MGPKSKTIQRKGRRIAKRTILVDEKTLKRVEKKKNIEIKQIHDYLSREIQYGKNTIKQHEKRWRTMLLEIAVPRMRSELEYTWHQFERTLESKDLQISYLLDDLKACEDRYQFNLSSHVYEIDRIIVLCHDQIDEIRQESIQIIQKLREAAFFERDMVSTLAEDHECNLKTMLFMLGNTKRESEIRMRGENLAHADLERAKCADFNFKFALSLEERINNMLNEYLSKLNTYRSAFIKRKKAIEEMTISDKQIQIAITKQWQQIKKLQSNIRLTKDKLEEIELKHKHRIEDLKFEKKYWNQMHGIIKQKNKREIDLDNQNLTRLTLTSNGILNYLQEFVNKGEKILQLGTLSSNLETSREKTLAFPTYENEIPRKVKDLRLVNDIVLSDMRVNSQLKKKLLAELWKEKELQADDNGNDYLDFCPEMKLFWLRLGNAEASKFRLMEQRDILREENEILKFEIFKYCQCLNCTSK